MNSATLIERRKEERIAPKNNTMFVKLNFTYPKGKELIKPINDISPSGLSFKMNDDEGYLLPGAPLKNITIKGPEYEKTIANSIVRNFTQIKADNPVSNRIGLEFLIKPFEKSIIKRKLLSSYQLRMPRYNDSLTPLLTWKISFRYKKQDITTTKFLNLSKFGIAFRIENPDLVLKKSDVLSAVRVLVDDELIYEGECLVVDLQYSNAGLVVRCSLKTGSIDLEKYSILGRKSQAAEEIKSFLLELNKIDDIEPEFKADVADLRFFLEKLESRLDMENQRIDNSNIKEEYVSFYKEKLLDSIYDTVAQRLDKFFKKLRILVSDFDQSRYDLYRYYFKKHLHHFFLKAPFIDRSFHKPLCYAGDYETMNMIYKNPCAGANLFAKLINKHIWQQPGSIAVRNRVPYLMNKFDILSNSPIGKNSNYVKIMNVGSGPAVEIQEMIKYNEDIDRFVFTLIDADSEALLYCQDKLLNTIRESNRNVSIKFVNKAVDQLIKEKNLADRLGKQDLIYSIGLFDYLSVAVIKRLTKRLYELLSDNGKLIIGNFNHLNTTKTYIEFVQDWYLIHRSKEEMLKFTEKIDNPKNIFFETESTNTTNFLVIEK